jgi:hypothetical protein
MITLRLCQLGALLLSAACILIASLPILVTVLVIGIRF